MRAFSFNLRGRRIVLELSIDNDDVIINIANSVHFLLFGVLGAMALKANGYQNLIAPICVVATIYSISRIFSRYDK